MTGGQSRRMGQDKASVLLAGRPLLQHMLDTLAAMGLRARVAGQVLAGFQPEIFVPDRRSGCGPVSGLATALEHSKSPLVLLVGVDLPLVSAALLAALLARARTTQAVATIPYALGRPQPLCAVYRRELGPAITELLAADTFKLMQAVEQAAAASAGRVDNFPLELLVSSGAVALKRPLAWEFLNCNTPADLGLAERLLLLDPQPAAH